MRDASRLINRSDFVTAVTSPQAPSPLDQAKQISPAAPATHEARERGRTDTASSEAQGLLMSQEPGAAAEDASSSQTDHPDRSHEGPQQQAADVPVDEQVSDIGHTTDSSMDRATTEASTSSASPLVQEDRTGPHEPADAAAQDSTDHVAIPDSPQFSPAPADDPASDAAGDIAAQLGGLSVPATISDVTRSRDDTQEIEGPFKREVQAHTAKFPFVADQEIAQPRRSSAQA